MLEKGALANTLDYYYQYGKYVMSQPQSIPLRSDMPFSAGSREQVLELWGSYITEQDIKVNTNEPANQIVKKNGHFEITTPSGSYESKNVVMAIGKLGNPRKLGSPGEDLEHVADRLVDPGAYSGRDILVVGGGDSAVEVALALSENNRVSISYRKSEFFRMNSELLNKVTEKIENKEIYIYFSSNVERFEEGFTNITLADRDIRLKSDFVFIKIGAEVPRPFLEKCGVEFSSEDRSGVPVRTDGYETSVPGLYLIGATGGRDLIKAALNEGYEVIELISGKEVEPVDEPLLREKLIPIPGNDVNEKLDYISSNVPMLSQIQKQSLREFVIQSEIKKVNKETVVFREKDYSTTFYSIADGVVVSTSEASPEKENFLRQGEFFGEISLLADRRRSSTIRTVDDTILIETPRRTMLKIINSEATVKREVDERFTLNTLQTSLSINIFGYEFKELAPKLEVMNFKKGEVICNEGDDADSFYVIRSGSVKISKKSKDDIEYVVTYLPSGSYFGETSLIEDNIKRGATVSAANSTEVVRVLSSDFESLLNTRPELENRIKGEMEIRNVETTALLQSTQDGDSDKSIISDFIKHGVVDSTDVLIIDEKKCIRCDNCVKACEGTHGGQTRLDRRPGPSFGKIHVPIACRHCEGAPCLQDCPPGDAIMRNADGVVTINDETCIGCGNCAGFCPYGVIFMVEAKKKPTLINSIWGQASSMTASMFGKKENKGPKVKKGIAVKCDLCKDISGGPACVRSCPTGAAVRVNPDYFQKIEFR